MVHTRLIGAIVGRTWGGFEGYLSINVPVRGIDGFGFVIDKENIYDQLLRVLNNKGGDFQSCQFSDNTYFKLIIWKGKKKIVKFYDLLNFPSLSVLVNLEL